jgi:hypothetical protein
MYMWVENWGDWMVYFYALIENIFALLTKISNEIVPVLTYGHLL